MPQLLASLQKQDLGHLRIIAAFWGIELESSDADSARQELAASLLDFELAAELIDSLPAQAKAALNSIAASDGRMPWAGFTREYGNIREMGAGQRDRILPHLNPESTAEVLYYRGLIGRAFFDTEKGPQEFAYIPDDLLPLIQKEERASASTQEPAGREASPAEKAHTLAADDRILDDVTTMLAALRLGHEVAHQPKLIALLNATGLTKGNVPQAEKVKAFLEAPRVEALNMLVEAWKKSGTFNELRLMPEIVCEGEWKNQPLVTREFLLELLSAIPQNKWWSLVSFVRAIKQKYADFQRPAGDYDSWFIKRKSDGRYLRGFEAWDEVDGALIRFIVTDVMFSLGLVDIARAKPEGEITAFRLVSDREGRDENGRITISSNGRISVPRLTPRAVRYQLARFCEWDEEKADEYRYRITAKSLAKAKEQGLKVEHLLALLAKHSEAGIPPALVKALKRWEINGTEARAETQVILRVSRPEVLEELRKSKAARFLGEVLSPTTAVVKGAAIQKIMEALAELGLLAEDSTQQEK
jgi:hypothetical protein